MLWNECRYFDKIEKSRRGNALDRKSAGAGRGWSSCQHVEQQVPGGLSFSWDCHSVRNGGLGLGRGPGLGVVIGDSGTEAAQPGVLTQMELRAWGDPRGVLLLVPWQKEEEHKSGWDLGDRM